MNRDMMTLDVLTIIPIKLHKMEPKSQSHGQVQYYLSMYDLRSLQMSVCTCSNVSKHMCTC